MTLSAAHAPISCEQVQSIVMDTFSMMLQIDLRPVNVERSGDAGQLTAIVQFTGSLHGALLLEASAEQACWFAEQFTGAPCPTLSPAALDAIGELANIIGVNVKALQQCQLEVSPPTVLYGSACAARISSSAAVWKTAFESSRGVFWVTYAESRKPIAA